MIVKITKVVDNNKIELEEQCTLETLAETRRIMVKEALYAIADLTAKKGRKGANTGDYEDEVLLPLATDKQKAYMDKLGIPYYDNTTKVDAQNLINQWKLEHNVQPSGGPGYYKGE